MRNLKKLLAVVVAICVLASFTLTAFAADTATLSADAQTCANIGVLVGTGSDGVTAEYAATTPTRAQAAVMVLRLTGNLAAAQAYTGTDNFADADTVSWAKPLMGFLKTHPELGFVGDGTNFNPAAKITAQEYYKVILTALGYAIPADYAYADTLTFAKNTVKLAMAGDVASFTIDNLAAATVEGLKGVVKGGTKTLAATLVDASKLDKAAAITAGLYSDVLTATAAQTGAKTIKVTFNRALTAAEKTAATISVKNGLVAYTVTPTWAADSSSVNLVYAYNYFAGDYTVTIGGITDPIAVTVVDEKVTKITINNEYLPKSTTAALDYTVLNQFNEEMDNQSLSINSYNATQGIAYGSATTLDLHAAAKDDVVIVTISHYATGVSVSKSVPVSDIANAKTISFGTVVPLSGKTRITEGETGLVLPYTFTDQYGKALKLSAKTAGDTDASVTSETIDGIKFMTSDATIVTPDTFAVDSDGVLTFKATGDGTVIISAIAPSTGAVGTVTIKIEAAAAVKTFTISNPGKLIALGDSSVVIPYTAVDTFGSPIAVKDFGSTQQASVAFVSSNPSVVTTSSFAWNGKNELVVTPIGSGTVTIYPTVGGVMQNSVTLDVKALAVPTRVVGLKDVPGLFQADATTVIDASKLNVIDQYNRPIDIKTFGPDAYTVVANYDGGTGTKVSLSAAPVTITTAAGSVTLKGIAAGSENLIFSLLKSNAGTVNTVSTFKTTVKTIADSDITGYSIDTIGTLYANSANNPASKYAVLPTLLGKDAAGNAVTIDQSIITQFTSSNPSIIAVNYNAKIYAAKAGTATIAAWKYDGTKLAEITVTAKDDAPYVATASLDNTSLALTTGGTGTITITAKDQYGVDIAASSQIMAYTSADTIADIASFVNGVVTINAGSNKGTATITFVTDTGIVVTAEVVVS